MINIVLIQSLPANLRKGAIDIDKKDNNNAVIDTQKEIDELKKLGKKYDTNFDIGKYMTNGNKIISGDQMTKIGDNVWIKKYSKGKPGNSFYNASTITSKFDGYDVARTGTNQDKLYDKNFQFIGTHRSGDIDVTVANLDTFVESGLVNELANHQYKGVKFNQCKKLDDGRYILYHKDYGVDANAAEPVAYVNQKGEIVDYKEWRTNAEAVLDFFTNIY